jgi:hypothetical protein
VLYVYGVTRAGRGEPDVKGMGSPPADVTLVESGPIAAAVSEIPENLAVQEEDARAHLQVLIDLLDEGPVLPLRMGTVSPDADAVRAELLDPSRSGFESRLDALEGTVELHVDADDDESAAVAEIARAAQLQPSARGDLQASLDLGHEIAELLVDRRRQLAEEIVGQLRPFALRDVPRSIIKSAEDPVLRWAFLVRRDDLEQFDEAVISVRETHPTCAVRYVGPLPPSHFVDWETESETPDDTDSFAGNAGWGW